MNRSTGWRPYVVKQGDHVSKLAHAMGFDADAVWNDEVNRELRESGRRPNVLAPGDILCVPEKPTNAPMLLLATRDNAYKGTIPDVRVAVVFHGEDGPLKNESYVITGLEDLVEGKSDDEGAVTVVVPIHTREVDLVFPARELAFRLRVGELDPVESDSGATQRLAHLGFDGWALGEAASLPRPPPDDGDDATVRAFQRARGLEETGVCDAATRAELEKAHGA